MPSNNLAEITGDDVVLHIGCSEQWATWAIQTYNQSSPGDVTQADVLFKESDGFNVVTAAKQTIQKQLEDDAKPAHLIDHATMSYRVGFDEDRARALLDDLETALEVGAAAHQLELRLTHQTLESLVRQFQRQVA